jgi:hypothetical protein
MGWEAGGKGTDTEAAMAMADDPRKLPREIQEQKRAMLEMQAAKARAREARKAQRQDTAKAQEELNKRGIVHGDVMHVVLADGTVVQAMLDLRPLPKSHEAYPRWVETDEKGSLPSPEWVEARLAESTPGSEETSS